MKLFSYLHAAFSIEAGVELASQAFGRRSCRTLRHRRIRLVNDGTFVVSHYASSRAEAELFCERLQTEGVPSRVETRALREGLEAVFCVLVAPELAHRARWVQAQLPPSESELVFLATGQLPGQEDEVGG